MKAVRVVWGLMVFLAVVAGFYGGLLPLGWIKPGSAAEEEEKAPETEVAVRTAPVVRATLCRFVEGYGVVEPEPAFGGKPAAMANVATPVAGVVAKVNCEAGQRVEAGAVLLQLDDRLAKAQEEGAKAVLESARASLAKLKASLRPEQVEIARLAVTKAKGNLEFTTKNFERQRKLAEQAVSAKTVQAAENDMNVARMELEAAEKQLALLLAYPTREELAEAGTKVSEAERALGVVQVQGDLLTVRSPISGTVLRVAINAGEAADTGKVLVELAALDRLIVNTSVSSFELPSLKTGIQARISIMDQASVPAKQSQAPPAPSATDKRDHSPILGTLQWISPQVDRKTDTVQVWIGVSPDAGLRPGQFARVRLVCEERIGRLAVPRESVYTDHEGHATLSIIQGDKAIRKSITIGLSEGELVEVEGDGVTEGAKVVTLGSYALPKETKVRILRACKIIT